MAEVAVIGTGYVGLTTGACMAKLGAETPTVPVVRRRGYQDEWLGRA